MKASQRKAARPANGDSLRFSGINWILLGSGVAVILAGYALLAQGSTAAAPLLLVLGYAVLLPLGIIR